ncbi:hypothetical protein SPRA44_480024 [Serratia proteamaculans]|nr:hypothetical protein SPRA44_480024 [Serratia proteamaculans]
MNSPFFTLVRAISDHWEGDLIQGSKNSYIVTLVERHSRFVMLAKIRDNKTITVISALIKQARELPGLLEKEDILALVRNSAIFNLESFKDFFRDVKETQPYRMYGSQYKAVYFLIKTH